MTFQDNEGDRVVVARFDAKGVNVMKITRSIDLEIFIDECNFALDRIMKDLKQDGGYDKEWRDRALLAIEEIEHKKMLANKKIEVVRRSEARMLALSSSPSDFKVRFYKAAEKTLDEVLFDHVKTLAMNMRNEEQA